MSKWELRAIHALLLAAVCFGFYSCHAEPCSFFGPKDIVRYDCLKPKHAK